MSCDWKDEKGLVVGETEERSFLAEGVARAKARGLLPSRACLRADLFTGVVGPQATHSCWLRAQEPPGAHLGWTGAGLDPATGRPMDSRVGRARSTPSGRLPLVSPQEALAGNDWPPGASGSGEFPGVRERSAGSLVAWMRGAAVQGL